MGIVRMKSLARMHVWWPKIDENIESHTTQEKTIIFTYLYGFPCNANARYMARADTEILVNVLIQLSVSIRLVSYEDVLLFCGDLGGD